MPTTRLPQWLRKSNNFSKDVHSIKKSLRTCSLKTVCEEARCPNLCECFERGTATFMIMGDLCTRNCAFCAVRSGTPKPPDPDEPHNLAKLVQKLSLKHVVITSVTRDDLGDGGASHFAQSVQKVREFNPKVTIEVLIPDFNLSEKAIKILCDSKPDILNHNLETVERLTPIYRDGKASYDGSLKVLSIASTLLEGMVIKSGLMVGLGESKEELEKCLRDIYATGCNAITIGQYLRPTRSNPEVTRYVTPEEFREYEKIAYDMGFKHVFSGPYVRSSYMAEIALSDQQSALRGRHCLTSI